MIEKAIAEEVIRQSAELELFLTEKQYTLADVGLTDKVAFDWTRSGLYLEEKTSKGRRKYNAIEYVWLRIVKDLREFGLSFDAIRNLKTYLLSKMEMQNVLMDILTSENENETELKEIQTTLKETFGSKERLKATMNEAKGTLVDTLLEFLIIQTVLSKANVHLLIRQDGAALVSEGDPIGLDLNHGDLLNGPYITYPLRHVLTQFIVREDLYNAELGEDMVELTDDEQKVLDLLRQDNLVSLSIKIANKEIKLIETEEEINVKDVKGKLVDYIKRNSYQEITYKTENGKIVSMKRKTKHK